MMQHTMLSSPSADPLPQSRAVLDTWCMPSSWWRRGCFSAWRMHRMGCPLLLGTASTASLCGLLLAKPWPGSDKLLETLYV